MEFYTKEILKDIPDNVTVVAATKYFDFKQMMQLYETGISHFGENRVESILEKMEQLKDLDITWHLIGTLQTKKAKKIIDKIDFLHSLDTIKLADEINKRRTSPLKCFIQVNISDEENKHGLNINEVIPFIKSIKDYDNIILVGLMGMAELTKDEKIIGDQFSKLQILQKEIKGELDLNLDELSIGMSNDYLVAIKHNATYLRLGSILFRKEV